mgnify:CR=1 FL=1
MKHKYYPGHPFIEKIIQEALQYDHIVIDSFAGFGGTTEGFSRLANYKVIACINHWDKAIYTHGLNHPDCLHIEEDFRTADLSLVKYMVDKIRMLKLSIQLHGWNSLECTNFSNAKGGMPRDGDSRTLAEHIDRYIKYLDFDVIWIENVKEFLIWGPMVAKEVNGVCPLVINKKKNTVGPWMIPDPLRKGEDFKRWNNYICSLGYDSSHRLLNAADYGVPQHRIRLFMQFTRKGIPACFPKPTHSKTGANGLPKWKAIKTCLDLTDEGTDLLSFRKNKTGKITPRIKSAKTIERLMQGCIKHVLNGEDFFMTKYMGNDSATGINNGKRVDEPSISVPTSNRQALVKARLIDYYFGNGYTKPDTEAAGVSGTKDGVSVSTVQFITDYNHSSVSNGIDQSSNTVLAADKFALSSVTILDQTYGKSLPINADNPSPTIPGIPKLNAISIEHFVMDTQFNNEAHSVDEAAHTVTANRKHYYIINCAWFDGHSKSVAEPSATIIARQDKMPQYLVVTETGKLAIEVYPHDPPHYVAMKKFMAANGIVSIKMRMLKETELLQIQDLPVSYKLTKSSTDNKKMIGNAVPPALVAALASAYSDGNNLNKKAA